ncbi:MAG TPA: hypothetical protein VHY20_10645 [Pirellulales bacterium]|jgi:hypothetical protein|nr:hypothetical protein [Pirellulales bacterium]
MLIPLVTTLLGAGALLVSWWSSRRMGHEFRYDVVFACVAVALTAAVLAWLGRRKG